MFGFVLITIFFLPNSPLPQKTLSNVPPLCDPSPKNALMGHVPGTGLYCDVDEYEEVSVKILNNSWTCWTQSVGLNTWNVCSCSQAAEYEGIKIFHSNSSIYFANSDLYVKALKEKVKLATVYVRVFISR